MVHFSKKPNTVWSRADSKKVFERKKRQEMQLKKKTLTTIKWDRRTMVENAFNCVFHAGRIQKILHYDPTPAVIVIAQKGIIAESGLRIACEEMGYRLPQSIYLKVHSGLYPYRTEEAERRKIIEDGAERIKHYFEKEKVLEGIQNKKNIILIDDATVGAGQVATLERAIEKTSPTSQIHVVIAFQGSHSKVPEEIDFPRPKGKIVETEKGPVYVYHPDLRTIKNDPVFNDWQDKIRIEIRKQLQELKKQ